MNSVAITLDNKVITKNGLISCTCCPPPTDPEGGDGGGAQCAGASTFLSFLDGYPPLSGNNTFLSGWHTTRLTNQEFLYFTTTPGTIRERFRMALNWNFSAATLPGALIANRFTNYPEQEKTYQPIKPTDPGAVSTAPPQSPDFFKIAYTPCYFESLYSTWDESDDSFYRAGLSESGIYTNCGLLLEGGLNNISYADGKTDTYVQVAFIRDDRAGVQDENKTHLMLTRMRIELDDKGFTINNPFASGSEVFNGPRSNTIHSTSVDVVLSTPPPFVPGPDFPASSSVGFTATVFGKQIPFSRSFNIAREFLNPDNYACVLQTLNYQFNNVLLVGFFEIEFIPDPP